MEDFIVSARKYRPATFRSVVGQQSLTTTLKNAVVTRKLAHAFLFCGPRGVGKTTCARIFAKTINCFHPTEDGEACNQCESCVSFNDQRSYNIHELDAASNNSVDDIRTLIEQVRIPPQIGQYKVYIVDEVHMLSTAAFNAFLKTLEEPPRHAIFVLATTEKHKILPTILSRCQIYDFNRISVNDTVEHLQYVALQEGITAEPEALNVIAQKADGGMRDALSIFDQVVSFTGGSITYKAVIDNLNVLDYDYYFRLIDAFLAGNVPQSLLLFNEVLSAGFEGQNFISGLSAHLRDLLVARDPQTVVLLEVGEAIGLRYIEQAKLCVPQFLYRALELATECELNYRVSKNKRLLVELALMRMCQIIHPIAPLSAPKPELQPIAQAPVAVAPQQPVQTAAPATPVAAVPVQPTSSPQATAQPVVPRPPLPQQPQPLQKKPVNQMAAQSISIRNIPEKKEQLKEDKAVYQSVVTMNTPINLALMEQLWSGYARQIPKERILAQKAMISSKIVFLQENQFELMIDSPHQKDILVEELPAVIGFLQKELQNNVFRFSLRVIEADERPRIFSPQDKFKAMVNSNPALYDLVEKFGLEIA